MNDLHNRLEDLTAQAVGDAAIPATAAVLRRGRRHRRRQVAAVALVLAALAATAVPVVRATLGEPAPVAPATGSDKRPSDLAGYWFGRTDATVFLTEHVTAAQRDEIRARLEASPAVHEVTYESRKEAYQRFREQFSDSPDLVGAVPEEAMPESFRVVLTSPERYQELHDLICPGRPAANGRERCRTGVDSMVNDQVWIRRLLVGTYWTGRADVSVMLAPDVTDEQRRALQDRIHDLPMVASVTYESSEEAAARLPDSELRRLPLAGGRSPDPSLPDTSQPGQSARDGLSLPSSLRVALRDPGQVAQFRHALCRSERTGDCAEGVAMVYEHPRKR